MEFKFKADDLVKKGRTNWKLITEIKEWMSTTHLPRISEEFIVLFLTACNNDIESTQRTIKGHFHYKKVAPFLFNNRDIDSDEIFKSFQILSAAIIPHTNDKGHALMFYKLEDNSFFKFHLVSLCKMSTLVADLQVYENPPIAFEVLIDIEKVSFKLLAKLKIGILRIMFNYLQEGLPMQFKALHILNCNPVFDKLMVIFRLCVKQEVLKLFKMYPPNVSEDELIKNGLQMHCMPSNYGGALGSVKELSEQTFQKLKEMKQFFEEEENLRKSYNY